MSIDLTQTFAEIHQLLGTIKNQLSGIQTKVDYVEGMVHSVWHQSEIIGAGLNDRKDDSSKSDLS